MKIYIDFSKQAITKIDSDVAYVGDVYSNVFELLFFNYGDNADWFPTMSQLAPNGREAGDFSADALEENETYDYVENDITYKRYTFTIGDGWVKMKGRSNFFIWVNKLVDSNTSLQRKCYGKVMVTLNESTDNYFIQDPYFNPKVKEYIDGVIEEDMETVNASIEAQNEAIDNLLGGSPKVIDTSTNILALTSNQGIAVATDNGYIYAWNGTSYYKTSILYQATALDNTTVDLLKNLDYNNFLSGNEITIDNSLFGIGRLENTYPTYFIPVSNGTRVCNKSPLSYQTKVIIALIDTNYKFAIKYNRSNSTVFSSSWLDATNKYAVLNENINFYIQIVATPTETQVGGNINDYLSAIKIYYVDDTLRGFKDKYLGNLGSSHTLKYGYYRNTGVIYDTPNETTNDFFEMYTDYIELKSNSLVNIKLSIPSSKASDFWFRWLMLDENYNVIDYKDGTTYSYLKNSECILDILLKNSNAKYLTFSFRSFNNYKLIINDVFDNFALYQNTIKKNKNFISISHQGFSLTSQTLGNSRLSSFIGASIMGFDYGETDIAYTSDNKIVCCHDTTFVDGNTSQTITIAEHTLAELKTYKYYGETIATLDEVCEICKKYDLGLFIDHLYTFYDTKPSVFQDVYNVIKKYGMLENIYWAVETYAQATALLNVYSKANIAVISFNNIITPRQIAEQLLIDTNNSIKVCVDVPYTLGIETIKTHYDNSVVPLLVWVVDSLTDYNEAITNTSGILSNKISYNYYYKYKL